MRQRLGANAALSDSLYISGHGEKSRIGPVPRFRWRPDPIISLDIKAGLLMAATNNDMSMPGSA